MLVATWLHCYYQLPRSDKWHYRNETGEAFTSTEPNSTGSKVRVATMDVASLRFKTRLAAARN
ncbi:MAG: hypothetical protein AAF989_06085 [Planctomycetota bacterium]